MEREAKRMTLSELDAKDPDYYDRIASIFSRCSSEEHHQGSPNRICRHCFDDTMFLAVAPILAPGRHISIRVAQSKKAIEMKRGKPTPGQIFLNCSASEDAGHSKSDKYCCEICFIAAIASARVGYLCDLMLYYRRSLGSKYCFIPEFEDPRALKIERPRKDAKLSPAVRSKAKAQLGKRLESFVERFAKQGSADNHG